MTNAVIDFNDIAALPTDEQRAFFDASVLAKFASEGASGANIFFTNAVRAWIANPAEFGGDLGKMLATIDATIKGLKGARKMVYKGLTDDFTNVMKYGLGADYAGKGSDKTLRIGNDGLSHVRAFGAEGNTQPIKTHAEAMQLIDGLESTPVITNDMAATAIATLRAESVETVAGRVTHKDNGNKPSYGKVEKRIQAIHKHQNDLQKLGAAIDSYNSTIGAATIQPVQMGASVDDVFALVAERDAPTQEVKTAAEG